MLTIEQMKIRKQNLGYSYEMIAETSGVPTSTVQKVLGGETVSPRYSTLAALNRVLGTEADDNPAYAAERGVDENAKPCAEETAVSYKARRRRYWPEEKFLRSFLPPKEQGEYTADDLELLPENLRAELIDGVLFSLGAPSAAHQLLAGEIHRQIANFIIDRNGPCEVFIAPFDVHIGDLEDTKDDKNVFQPDVLICCERKRLYKGKYLSGAPDFVVEILSPSTAVKDKGLKMGKYMTCDVREYWMVDPKRFTVQVFHFAEDQEEIYSFTQKIPVGIYNGDLEIDLSRMVAKITALQEE